MVSFDPQIHLNIRAPETKTTFAELGLPSSPLSPIAATAPFSLFTPAAVKEIRREILSPALQEKFLTTRKHTSCYLREYPSSVAPFIHAIWNSEEVLAAVSCTLGVDVIPAMPVDIGHTNFNFPFTPEGKAQIRALPLDPAPTSVSSTELAKQRAAAEEDMGDGVGAVVNFHNDAYPLVCVVMLSDTSNMVGGETAIKKGDGSIIKLRGPTFGTAVVMQGRYVTHAALQAFSKGERVTMVTSFRPRDPLLLDSTDVRKLHLISKRNRLNGQVVTYRMNVLAARFAHRSQKLKKLAQALPPDNDCDGSGGAEIVDPAETDKWLQSQIEYLQMTRMQLMV